VEEQQQIFGPMIAQAALTFAVLLTLPFARFRAVKSGKATAADFRVGESARVPPEAAVINRNYVNLLESPVLFFVVCLALHAAGAVDGTALTLAWAFVGFRVLHSAVHLTYNNVMHRLALFVLSVSALGALWIWFARAVL
jgi:hypothetical protein